MQAHFSLVPPPLATHAKVGTEPIMASNELALSGVASTSLKEAHTTAGFARGCKLGASVVNQLVGAQQPHICAVRGVRPGFQDVRPGNRDALAISQRNGAVRSPVARWKGNGVSYTLL